MGAIAKRIKEPSTWRGIVGIAAVFGIVITPELQDAIAAAAVGLISVIEIVRREFN